MIPLGPVAFNASLENSVVFTSTFLTLPFVGGFQSKNNNIPIPFTSGDLPDYCNDEMINILIDEYMFDSLAYVRNCDTKFSRLQVSHVYSPPCKDII